jgi:hypothetical protein
MDQKRNEGDTNATLEHNDSRRAEISSRVFGRESWKLLYGFVAGMRDSKAVFF